MPANTFLENSRNAYLSPSSNEQTERVARGMVTGLKQKKRGKGSNVVKRNKTRNNNDANLQLERLMLLFMSKWMKKSEHFSTNFSYTPQFMARQFVSPTFPNSKCWICDSIKGPFPVVSAFLNHSLTQIWSPLNPNPDLVSWLAAPHNSEWVIYQFLEWWETKLFMAQLFFFLFFLYPNLICHCFCYC